MYKCRNSNIQSFPTAKGCQHQGPNSQRHPTLSQKTPVSLIYPLPRHRNLRKGLHKGSFLPLSVWTYHHRTSAAGQKFHTVNTHPSNLYPYHLHPSITSDINLFHAFMDSVKNSSALRACAFKYNVDSRIIKNLLDEYEYH